MIKFLRNFLFKSYHRPTAKILHIFILFKKIFYNKKTILFSEKIFLLKNPPNSTVYYNFFGRLLTIITNIIFIILFNQYFSKNTFIDKGESKKDSNLKGNNDKTWPPQSLTLFENINNELNKEFYENLEKNYNYSLDLFLKDKFLDDSPWWKLCREEYKTAFLDDQKKINVNALENFRLNTQTNSAIINDLNFLKSHKDRVNKIKSLSLINLYHKLSEFINLDVLRITSDSYIGNNICLNYRNQRLSHTILRHAYFCSQIMNNTNLDQDKKNVILDLGGGYGSLVRLLKNIYRQSTFVIFEIPEACFLATYFLKKNFPYSKIGQALDFENLNKINLENLEKYDFVILPQPFLDKFNNEIIDLSINTISLGEMTNETQNYYIKNLERVTKDYFYSVNRPHERIEKYNAQGFYNWKFNSRWRSIIYNFSHTYHIEFLGKKIK